MTDDFSLSDVQVSLAPMERYEEYLQSKGMRSTQERRLVVEQVFDRHEHFDADELMEGLARCQGRRRVSRPTVYRTLGSLVDAGLLRKMELGGRAVYEHDYGYPSHDHLHCERCNKLIEFHSEAFEQIREAVAREHRFRATGHRLIITGVCDECGRLARRNKRPVDLV